MNKQIAALASDEENCVMWDMDAVLADVQDEPSVKVETRRLKPEQWLTIDPIYALTTDVTKPIILFELPNDQFYIADGNHRLYRAVKEQIKEMNVIIVAQKKHLSYLYRSSEQVYHKVIEALRHEGIFIGNPQINP